VAFFVWGATVAVFALINQYVSINSVDLSNHVKNAKLTLDVENLDTTAQQSGGWKAFIGGLKSGTLALEFEDDEAAGSVDATLWSALGTVVTFEVRADAGARSATNPGYTGSILVTGTEVGGKLGELAGKSVSYPTSGTVLRQTS
jgi:hypothetical protein